MKPEITYDAEVIIDFFCGRGGRRGVLGDLRSALLCQGKRADTIARSLGFVNAEHEALVFLTGPLFRAIVHAILASRNIRDDSSVAHLTWVDYAQALLEQRYKGKVVMNPEEEIAKAPRPKRRRWTKPHDSLEHEPIGGNGHGEMTVLEILHRYDQIVEAEETRRRMLKFESLSQDEKESPIRDNERVYSYRPG